jgi:hypothetical protein
MRRDAIMNTKVIRWLGLILVLSLGIFGAMSAASVTTATSETTPAADMYINLNAPSAAGSQTDPNNLWVSLSGDPTGNCVTTRITYLKFSLTGLAPGEAVDPALKLILTRSGATGNAPGHSVGLYQLASSWDENYPWNAAPLPGARIGTLQPFPATNGAQVIFSGAALVSYVQSHASSDHVVSFAVQLVSGGSCPAGVVSAVFDSREDASGSAPILTVKTPLETTPSPTPGSTPSPTPGTPGDKDHFMWLPLVLRSR